MALMPKQYKYRKQHRGSLGGLSKGGNFVSFGDYGIQVLERGWITSSQIEACRVAINRFFKRQGKIWICIFPDKPVAKRPLETRMGKGKGATAFWVAPVKPGRILFEVSGVPRDIAQQALRRSAAKLGLKTRFVQRLHNIF